ncbi:hypothetical protein [Xanthobacter sediminis]
MAVKMPRLVRTFLVAAVVLAAVAYARWNKTPAGASNEPAHVAAIIQPPPQPHEMMDIKDIKWGKGGFGSVAIVTFTVTNGNALAVRDPVISCSFYGKSGTLIDIATETIYEPIKGKSSRRIKDFNFGFIAKQADGMNCRVLNARWN